MDLRCVDLCRNDERFLTVGVLALAQKDPKWSRFLPEYPFSR